MATSSEVQQRHFALLLALMETPAGLTRQELLQRIPGYRDDAHSENTRKRFERDKLLLRELGYEIETLGDEEGDQFTRYWLRRDSLTPITALTFDAEERFLLGLALQAFEARGSGEDARRARLKLRADPAFANLEAAPVTTSPLAADPAYQPLARACEDEQTVRFDYQVPGNSEPLTRTVQAWGLALFGGRWFFQGFDLDREEERTFLLRRITSPVRVVQSEGLEPGPADAAPKMLAELQQLWDTQTATVRVVPGSDADMRLRARAGTEVVGQPGDATLRIHYLEVALTADELAGYGPDVRVTEPTNLAEAVRERLERIAAAHPTPAAEGSDA